MLYFCNEGHPPHDPAVGCGPCLDEQLAGYGDRPDALPLDVTR